MLKPIKYPVDKTGLNLNNKVIDEIHITSDSSKRCFVPHYGPFYVESIRIETVDGIELIPKDDFLILQPYQEASVEIGKDIACIIYVHNRAITKDIKVTYQVVGGEWSWSVYAIQDLLDSILIDDRAVKWMSILGKPLKFDPLPHPHDIGDTYGWEYLAIQIENLTRAIMYGDEESHDELRDLIRNVNMTVLTANKSIIDHLSDMDNPHETTKQKIQLGNVENYPVATLQDILDASPNKYMTAETTFTAIYEHILKDFFSHVLNNENPHGTTKEHVKLGLVQNNRPATNDEAKAAADVKEGIVTTEEYITIRALNYALRYMFVTYVDPHHKDRNNPHGVTKTTVNLEHVENYPPATDAIAIAGTSDAHYLTPKTATAQFLAMAEELGWGSGDGGGGGDIEEAFRQHLLANNPHRINASTLGVYTTAQIDTMFDDLSSRLLPANGVLEVARGGTGVSTVEAFATALGLGTNGKRDLFIGTSAPSNSLGKSGDIYLRYE